VPSTLLVTNTGNQGTGSLRQAIADANALLATDTANIVFNIPTSDKGYNASTGIFTISLTSSISAITHANVTIDGTTQLGYSASPPVTGGHHGDAAQGGDRPQPDEAPERRAGRSGEQRHPQGAVHPRLRPDDRHRRQGRHPRRQ
jgi:hypothetical protein